MMGAPPPTVTTRTAVPHQFMAILEPFREALEGCGARGPFASVAWGPPDPDDGLRHSSEGQYRIVRGGSYRGTAQNLRSAVRLNYAPDSFGQSIGVRPARSIER